MLACGHRFSGDYVLVHSLAWLDRRAAPLLAAALAVGLALPELASLLRPLLTPAVIGLLVSALLRIDWTQARGHARRPLFAVLVDWVEREIVPSKTLTLSGGAGSMPLCSYPQYPRYVSGPASAATSYRCATSNFGIDNGRSRR